jgi:hypothetical protein
VGVNTLLDVLLADEGRESLLVVGDVGAHHVGRADARVGEGVLGGLLDSALLLNFGGE